MSAQEPEKLPLKTLVRVWIDRNTSFDWILDENPNKYLPDSAPLPIEFVERYNKVRAEWVEVQKEFERLIMGG